MKPYILLITLALPSCAQYHKAADACPVLGYIGSPFEFCGALAYLAAEDMRNGWPYSKRSKSTAQSHKPSL